MAKQVDSRIDTSMKYYVKIRFKVDGVVSKDDILGAIFGQLEPIVPRELFVKVQDKNRKDVNIQIDIDDVSLRKRGITEGYVHLYTRLDRYETAILAAAIEAIKKVGAFRAEFEVISFENMHLRYIEQIKKRAADLLLQFETDHSLELDLKRLKEDIQELVNELTSKDQIIEYGPDRLPAGPDVDKSDEIIIVEGKNDVYALLKAGYRNAIAMKGADVPKTLIELAKKKARIIAFLDRDSQGFKNLQTLLTRVRVDYIALPPEGKYEVEKLTPSEIRAALENLITPSQFTKSMLGIYKFGDGYREIKPLIDDLDSMKPEHVRAYDENLKLLGEFATLEEALKRKPFAIVYSGHIDQMHISKILKSGHIPRIVVAKEQGEIVFKPAKMALLVPGRKLA